MLHISCTEKKKRCTYKLVTLEERGREQVTAKSWHLQLRCTCLDQSLKQVPIRCKSKLVTLGGGDSFLHQSQHTLAPPNLNSTNHIPYSMVYLHPYTTSTNHVNHTHLSTNHIASSMVKHTH